LDGVAARHPPHIMAEVWRIGGGVADS